jgi:hypothetical protein
MSDRPSNSNGRDGRPASVAGTPGWVKVFGIVALVLVLFVALHTLVMGGRMMDAHRMGPRGGAAPQPHAADHGGRQP